MLDTSTQPTGPVTQVTGPGGPSRLRRRRRVTEQVPRHLRAHLTAYLMITPMVVLLGIFVIWPLVYAFYLSFFEMSFYKDAEFVGFDFYKFVLTDPDFYESLMVGLKLALMVVPAVLVLALLLASFIATLSKRMAAFMKTTVYVPAVVSSVVAAIIFVFIYQDEGVANWFIGLFGQGPLAWLNTSSTALPAVAIPSIWLGFGVSTLIMLAGILDIPDSYFESAKLDGANFWQRTRYITVPSLRNVILFLLVSGLTVTIQEFQLPLVMTNGGPVNATNTPNLYIFNSFRDATPYATSYSLTAALLLFIVLGTISIIIFRVVSSEKSTDA